MWIRRFCSVLLIVLVFSIAAGLISHVQAAITVTKTDGLDEISPGGAVPYTVKVTNNGASSASVYVQDFYSDKLSPGTWSYPTAQCGSRSYSCIYDYDKNKIIIVTDGSGPANYANYCEIQPFTTLTFSLEGVVNAAAAGCLTTKLFTSKASL